MIELRHATVRLFDWGCETIFHDGAGYGAHDHPKDFHYRALCHRLGYQDDTRLYAIHHEIAHSLIEEALYDRPSRILWGLAHNEPLAPHDAVYEEQAAMMLQRFVMANERPIIGGVDWDAIKRRALKIFP